MTEKHQQNKEYISAATQFIEKDPETSIRGRAEFTGICPSITWKSVQKDPGVSTHEL